MINSLLAYKSADDDNSQSKKILQDFQDYLLPFKTKKAVFDYKTILISLYGLLENFVESLIKDYLIHLSQIVGNYNSLPPKILETHFHLSANLINLLAYPKYFGVTTKEEIVGNLYFCNAEPTKYKLNVHAYTNHTANFKASTIENFFSSVGIYGLSNKIRKHAQFVEYVSKAFSDMPQDMIPEQQLFEKLDDLALRRNDISHGVEGDIISIDLLKEYIEFVELYGVVLFDLIIKETLPYEVEHKAKPLKAAIKVFDNRIICLNLENIEMKVGDTLIAKEGSVYLSSEIKEIQVDRVSIESITEQQNLDVGIQVEFHAKLSQSFYLLQKAS
jgi:hypothetical protein